jgi:hypothetical protein
VGQHRGQAAPDDVLDQECAQVRWGGVDRPGLRGSNPPRDRRAHHLACRVTDYPFLDILWTMLIFFAWVIWFWLLIRILSDIFSRRDLSGWGKAGWILFVIVLPFLGVLIYLGTNGAEMGERDEERTRAAMARLDGPSAEIEKANELLRSGAIDQAEFNAIKAKAIG